MTKGGLNQTILVVFRCFSNAYYREHDNFYDIYSDITTDNGGLFSNMGIILVIVAVGLLLLAGAGVMLLRRG
jgi:hypothetical protein